MKTTIKFRLSLVLVFILVLLSTSIYAVNLPNKVLPYMSRGQDVIEVQKALGSLGFDLSIDGIYGPGTKNAMIKFQRNHGQLSNDGIYGPATKKVLQIALDGSQEGDPPPVNPPAETGKIAYLTFDDGPSNNITPRILDILDDYAIKATFFMLGNKADQNPNMVKRVHNSGHSIGNHSYSHDYNYIYANINNFLGEAYNTQSTFKNILGQSFSSRLLRFPGGSFESYKAPYRQAVKNIGFDYYDWNALNGDAEGVNIPAASLVSRLKETVRGQDELIVLMHDSASKSTTADALPEIIDYLKAQGYSFDKLSE